LVAACHFAWRLSLSASLRHARHFEKSAHRRFCSLLIITLSPVTTNLLDHRHYCQLAYASFTYASDNFDTWGIHFWNWDNRAHS
jgi:hypothetical protein